MIELHRVLVAELTVPCDFFSGPFLTVRIHSLSLEASLSLAVPPTTISDMPSVTVLPSAAVRLEADKGAMVWVRDLVLQV